MDLLTAIGEKGEVLTRKAMESVEICQVFAAAMGVLEDTAKEKGARHVLIGNTGMTGKRIIAHASFSRLEMPARVVEAPRAAGSFMTWIQKDAYRLYCFMRENPSTISFLEDLVRLVDTYSRDKGRKFEEVAFAEDPAPFLDKEGYLVLELADEIATRNWMDKVSRLWRGNR